MAIINPTEEQLNEWLSQQTLRGGFSTPNRLADLVNEPVPMNSFRNNSTGRTVSLPSIQEQGGMSLDDLLAKTGATMKDKVDVQGYGPGFRLRNGGYAGLDPNGKMWELRPAPSAADQLAQLNLQMKRQQLEGGSLENQIKQAQLNEARGLDPSGSPMEQASQKFYERKYGKPETGYRWKPDGTVEAIPGGKADMEAQENKRKGQLSVQSARDKAKIVSGKVDEALGQTGFVSTGYIGKKLSELPGSHAYDLNRTLETVKANIGFQELANMRAASPTGGALGSIAVRELDFLQAAIASLDQGQSTAQLKKNLEAVKTHFNNWKQVMEQVHGGGTAPAERTVVRTGKIGNRKVAEYSDGSYDYVD